MTGPSARGEPMPRSWLTWSGIALWRCCQTVRLRRWKRGSPFIRGLRIISRDRSGTYAQGARKGAPTALQVADRFHILVNLYDALKRLFERKQDALQEEAGQQQSFLNPAGS